MGIGYYLQFGFAQHALEAAFLVAVSCGLIGPFVISRSMAFAVHGTSELAFTGAVAGLLVANNPLVGALVGAVVVAGLIGTMGQRPSERDSSIGVILAAGLGLGVYLLSFYHGFASEALNILFGNIFGVSTGQIILLACIALGVAVVMGVLWRPLLFSSVDPDVAQARGVRTGLIRSHLPLRPGHHGDRSGATGRYPARSQPGHHSGGGGPAALGQSHGGGRALRRLRGRLRRRRTSPELSVRLGEAKRAHCGDQLRASMSSLVSSARPWWHANDFEQSQQ